MAERKKISLEQAFGLVVRERRLRLGLSQEALAFEADLHRTYISMLERGLRVPSLATIALLAEALGTRASTLVAEAEGTS